MAWSKKVVASKAISSTGTLSCPECGSPVLPMSSGKGFRCNTPGNRYINGKWSICSGVIWSNAKPSFFSRPKVERAEYFPKLDKPTEEQKRIRQLLSTSPAIRGGRCIITNAGPGTGKTSTISWSAEGLWKRLGNLNNYPMLAFNTNAKDVFLQKLPVQVPDIATINGWFGAAQNYTIRSYDAKKLKKIAKELTEHIPWDDRPNLILVINVLERLRDCCIFKNTDDKNWWKVATQVIMDRFPSIQKKADKDKNFWEKIEDYLPQLALRSLNESKTIDIQEQFTRPVIQTMKDTGWEMRLDLINKNQIDWTGDDVEWFANLIRKINISPVKGMIVDEAQDLSLSQMAVILAQTYRNGELTVIGDDSNGQFGDSDYKAGQAIYGWRGAFSGSMKLIARLWEELTGEEPIETELNVTFRHGPEICESYRQLNSKIRSARPAGYSQAFTVSAEQAFTAWLNISENDTALWITRTNTPLSGILLQTLKSHKSCCIRGGDDFMSQIDAALYPAAGYYGADGEYKTPLNVTVQKLSENPSGNEDKDMLEPFLIDLGKAIMADPNLLTKASLPAIPTVGNMRRFISFFANQSSNRVLTTVYRCKGDEADLAIVDDIHRMNENWGNVDEDFACRHVAASRAKKTAMFVGKMIGVTTPTLS